MSTDFSDPCLLIPALGGQREVDLCELKDTTQSGFKFKDSLVYRMGSRTATATW